MDINIRPERDDVNDDDPKLNLSLNEDGERRLLVIELRDPPRTLWIDLHNLRLALGALEAAK